MDRAEIQGWFLDPGHQQMDCGKSHDLTVDVNRGESGRHDPGFRGVIEAAQTDILGNGNSQIFKYLQGVYGNKIIGADKHIRQCIQLPELFRQIFLIRRTFKFPVAGSIASDTEFFRAGQAGQIHGVPIPQKPLEEGRP